MSFRFLNFNRKKDYIYIEDKNGFTFDFTKSNSQDAFRLEDTHAWKRNFIIGFIIMAIIFFFLLFTI